ncbi:MAG: GtrA family protein [Acidiphilium sp.]|nr:GtrA family protein [Acidiphilium sp.]
MSSTDDLSPDDTRCADLGVRRHAFYRHAFYETNATHAIQRDEIRKIGGEVMRFLAVGSLGYVVNFCVYLGLRGRLSPGIETTRLSALLVGFVVAASTTWVCHRLYTFKGAPRLPAARQWALFLGSSAIGAIVYTSSVLALIHAWPVLKQIPALAMLLGSGGSAIINFTLSRLVVFKAHRSIT